MPDEPHIQINNKVLILLISIWAVFTQIKDAIAGWALRTAQIGSIEKDTALNHTSIELMKERCEKIERAVSSAAQDRVYDSARINALETAKSK